MNIETKVVKVTSQDSQQAVENYQKLGYRILSVNESVNTLVVDDEIINTNVSTLTLERDKDIPGYNRLVDIENNVKKLEGLLEKEKYNLLEHNTSTKRALASGTVGMILAIAYIFCFICAGISSILMLAEFTIASLITTLIFVAVGVGLIILRKYLGKKIENKKETTNEIEELKTKINEYYEKAEKVLNEK